MSRMDRGRAPLCIGPIVLKNPILLAPMSGITDLPFRLLVQRLGAGLVTSEMVASEQLVKQRPDFIRRADGGDLSPFVIQLAGRHARWMAEGARMAADLGADVVDINMGCPAKQVTRGLSGSALMRDEDHALALIDAVVGAVEVPVTLKMRMGWDHDSLNAPRLASRAEEAGVRMITVHGRTRCQFFTGKADWAFVARVKAAVSIPVIVNGDAKSCRDIPRMLEASNADGVMIGRGACGKPWFPGQAAALLETGRDPGPPDLGTQRMLAQQHYESVLCHHGTEHGVRIARKHLGWYVDTAIEDADDRRAWRRTLCRESDPLRVKAGLAALYDRQMEATA